MEGRSHQRPYASSQSRACPHPHTHHASQARVPYYNVPLVGSGATHQHPHPTQPTPPSPPPARRASHHTTSTNNHPTM
jgi:hypothetical protein